MPRAKKIRRCRECLALVFPGEGRCRCGSVKPHHQPAQEGSLEWAHNYHLIQSIKSGSWSKTGYRAAHNRYRDAVRNPLRDSNPERPGWQFRRSVGASYSKTEIAFFVFRCDCARQRWRDEFASLMCTRLEL